MLGLIPWYNAGSGFSALQSIVDRVETWKSDGNVTQLDVEAAQRDITNEFGNTVDEFVSTLNTFYNFFDEASLNRIQSLSAGIAAPEVDDDDGTADAPVRLVDSDDDDIISAAATIRDGNDTDYFAVELAAHSIYTLIAGPDSSSDLTPDIRIRDAGTHRALETTITQVGDALRIGFDTEAAQEVIIEVSADAATTYELGLHRRDGPDPSPWDPARDDYRNWIDDERLPMGEVRFQVDSAVVSGTLNHRADPDIFEIPGTEGWAYDITMLSSDEDVVTFDLLDSDGRQLAQATGARNDRISDEIAEESGPLYLRVTNQQFGSGDEVLDYEILVERSQSSRLDDTIGETRQTAATLALGSAVTSEIDYDDDSDMFEVDLGSSFQVKTFDFRLEALDPSDPVSLRLYDSDGNRIREDDTTWFDTALGSGEQGVYVKGDPGRVYVEVSADDGGSDYRLSVTERSGDDIPADASTRATVSYVTQEGTGTVSANAQIENSVDVDWFRVDLDAAPSGGLWSYYLEDQVTNVGMSFVTRDGLIYDDDPVNLSTDDDSISALRDGTHYFSVSYSRDLGPYIPEVVRYDDDHANHIGAATRIVFQADGIATATGQGEIRYDADVFAVDVAAGQGILVELQERDGNDRENLDFEILTAEGVELRDSDQSDISDDLQVLDDGVLVSERDQTLYVKVRGGARDPDDPAIGYDLRVLDLASTDLDDDTVDAARGIAATTAQDDDVLSRVLNGPDDVDFVRLRLAADTIYTFRTDDDPSRFPGNPVMELFDASGTRIFGAEDDAEARSGLEYRVDHYRTGPHTEEVFLKLSSAPYTTRPVDVGPFSIEIDATPVRGARSPGDSWTERLTDRGERTYDLTLPEGYAVIASIDDYSPPTQENHTFDGDDIRSRIFDYLSAGDWNDSWDASPGEVVLINERDGKASDTGSFEIDWRREEAGTHSLHLSSPFEIDRIGAVGTTGNFGRRILEDLSLEVAVDAQVDSFFYGSLGDRRDDLRLTLEQGQAYTVSLTGQNFMQSMDRPDYQVLANTEIQTDFAAIDLSDVTVHILNARLEEIARFAGDSAQKTFTPYSDGTYYVSLRTPGGVDGGYSAGVVTAPLMPTTLDDYSHGGDIAIVNGDFSAPRETVSVSGAFETAGDIDTVALAVQAGHRYALTPDGAGISFITTEDGIALADQSHLGEVRDGVLTAFEDAILHLDLAGPPGGWDLRIDAAAENSAPDLGAPITVAGQEDDGAIQIAPHVPTDPDGDAFTLRALYDQRFGQLLDGDGRPLPSATEVAIDGNSVRVGDDAPQDAAAFFESLQFLPAANWSGDTVLRLSAADMFGGRSQSDVTIQVSAVPDAPSMTLPEEILLHADEQELGLDAPTDPDDDMRFIRIDALPSDLAGLTVGPSSPGNLPENLVQVGDLLAPELISDLRAYRLDAPASTLDDFAFTILDHAGNETALGTRVVDANDTPVAAPDTARTDRNTTITFDARDLLGNDRDEDADTLEIVAVQNARKGEVRLREDNSIAFTPAVDHVGLSGFDYTIADGRGGTGQRCCRDNRSCVEQNP